MIRLAFFLLVITTCATQGSTQYLTQRLVNVALSKTDMHSCDEIGVTYSVVSNETVKIPVGAIVIGNNKLRLPVIQLTFGLDFLVINSELMSKENEFVVRDLYSLKPLSVHIGTIKLSDYFPLNPGEFYIKYSYLWNTRELSGNIITSEISSERYYLMVNSEGCVRLIE